MHVTRISFLAAAGLLCACTPTSSRDAPSAASGSVGASSGASAHVAPPWPAPSAEPSAPGFELRTIRHQTIHAQLLVPKGSEVTPTEDAHGYPRVDLEVAGERVFLQFDSGVGAMGVTLRKEPPTVHGIPVIKSAATKDGVAAWYEIKHFAEMRVSGFAPGVKCQFEGRLDTPKDKLEQIFTVCSSLRSPPPGKWRAATSEERAHGGMTDVPEGAWVESAKPNTPGSLLRPGRFAARMYLGRFAVSGTDCPADYDKLRTVEAPEIEVKLVKKQTPHGDVWIRNATEEFDGDRYPAATIVFAHRASRCCRAEFVPWLTAPSASEIDYAIALCDTYRSE